MKAAISVIARRLPGDAQGFQMKIEIETWEAPAPLILTRRTRVLCTTAVDGTVTVTFDPIERVVA